MPFEIPILVAESLFPEYIFVKALTPSEQKAAFHVKDNNDNDLCLKIINPNLNMDRMSREIIALQSLSHPNVVNLIEYTFSTKDGQTRNYIIEEFIEGSDLSNLLINGQSLSIRESLKIFIPLAKGLSAIGKLRIVHRDLKPNNVRIRNNGTPVIIDFGLARLLNLPDITNTAEGAAIGTPQFFAPEQFIGTKYDIDHRTDLFAYGILLYKALIGNHPFYKNGMTITELRDAICYSKDYLADKEFNKLPPNYQLLINKLLEKDRFQRLSNAELIVKILNNIRSNS